MATLENTISKAIVIASPEVLKKSTLFLHLIEDLSPELLKERLKLEQMYSDKIGKLLFSVYGSKNGMLDPAWKEIKGILEQNLGVEEEKQEWFVKIFFKAFCNTVTLKDGSNLPQAIDENEVSKNRQNNLEKCLQLSSEQFPTKDLKGIEKKQLGNCTNKFVNPTTDNSNSAPLNSHDILQKQTSGKKVFGLYVIVFGLLIGIIAGHYLSKNKKNVQEKNEAEQEETISVLSDSINENDINSNHYIEGNINDLSIDDIQYWGVITSTYSKGIAIHPEPQKDSAVLGRILYQEVFPIYFIEPNTMYGYTSYNGIEGYINLDYAEISEIDGTGELYYVSNDYEPGIAVRTNPSVNAQLICRLPYQTQLYVMAYIGDWAYIKYAEIIGWMHLNYISLLEIEERQEDMNDYILPQSAYKYINEADIVGFSLQKLNYARNEIFARHGRCFVSQELMDYFNSTSWYAGVFEPDEFDDTVLNEYERVNAQFLSKIEYENNSDGYVLDQSGYDIYAVLK